ncbi:MAG: hypothetical protein AAF587_11000 [Bacteroidota bacterium]
MDDSRSKYQLFYEDEAISFPEALSQNTGVSGLWKAYMLTDAPQPTLLAGSQSVYLITEENQAVNIRPISEQTSSFASLQWLDSLDGQPGIKEQVYATDDTGEECELTGGRFLLVNQTVVLDLKDLSIVPFQLRSSLTEDYSAMHVVAFSPDQRKIVYMGHIYQESKDHYALLVYDFKTNEAQTIPFDRTETRLHDPFALSPMWLSTYFVWEDLSESGSHLQKQQLDSLSPWEGHFTREKSYSVSPAKPDMQEILANFAKDHLRLGDADVERETFGTDVRYSLSFGQSKLSISYLESMETVYMSPHLLDEDEKTCIEVIQEVGTAFNTLLQKGEYQSLFTAY